MLEVFFLKPNDKYLTIKKLGRLCKVFVVFLLMLKLLTKVYYFANRNYIYRITMEIHIVCLKKILIWFFYMLLISFLCVFSLIRIFRLV